MTVPPTSVPGLNPRRLVTLMKAAIDRCELDLRGYDVFTEAASGAYLVTPVLAAMAGARQVVAVTRTTRYGTAAQIAADTMSLAALAGVSARVDVVTEKAESAISRADIVTNSGHVRPIDARMISWMKPTAVIPLMYEAWEYRDGDIDLAACRKRGIRMTGTNERHRAVDVFSFLGVMAVKLLLDAGVAVYSSRILLLCDNAFGAFIVRDLTSANATVDRVESLHAAPRDVAYDAVLIALTPGDAPVLSAEDIRTIGETWPGAVVAVYWGDVDRAALTAAGCEFWPREAPPLGHMGVLPSAVGPEPIIRLQSGSLKAAEAMLRYVSIPDHPAHAFGQPFSPW